MADEDHLRTLPQSDLDFNLMVTDTLWGSPLVNDELKEQLTREYYLPDPEEPTRALKDEQGRPLVRKEALWGLLSYYTRDLRLGNLSSARGEFEYVQYYLDYAGDLLKENYLKAFIVALSRAITLTEITQSRGGFLRKQMTTLRTEEVKSSDTDRKSLLGKKGGS